MADNDKYLIEGHYYQYDLKWLIDKLLEFENSINTIIDLQTIHYADPIQWDITTQYSPNTVVVNPKNGTAYMSKKSVPAGIQLDNEDYWVVIFNYQKIYEDIMAGVAYVNGDRGYANKDLLVNDLVWDGTTLYRVTRDVSVGSKLIDGANITPTSIESLLSSYYGRNRVTQVANDTLNVSGDYTLNAGDIAETSDNRTIKVTQDREINVDGSDSVHVDGASTVNVDGASTVNVGGLRTENYVSNRDVKVVGTETIDYGSVNVRVHSNTFPITFDDKTVDLHDITDYVSITQFGAIGDGITDDTEAFRKASRTGRPIKCTAGAKYKISGNANIQLSNDFDGNGATFIPTNDSGNVFVLDPPSNTTTVFSESVITRTRVLDKSLFGKTFNLVTPIELGTRTGTSTKFYVNYQVVTDSTGAFSEILPFDIISGTYTAENIHNIDTKVAFGNCTVDFSSVSDGSVAFVRVTRSNVSVHDISYLGNHRSTGESRVVVFSRCSYLDIGNLKGFSPFTASGYIISGWTGAYVYVHDTLAQNGFADSWGAVGISYVHNITYNRCSLSRIDCHYYAHDITITYSSTPFITIPGGSGFFTVDHCNLSSSGSYILDQRGDLPNFWNGTILVSHCTFSNNDSLPIFRYWTRSTSNTLTEQLAYGTKIVFDSCIFSKITYAQPFVLSTPSSNLANMITFIVQNCSFDVGLTLTGVQACRFDSDKLSPVYWINNTVNGYVNTQNKPTSVFHFINSSAKSFLFTAGALMEVNGCVFDQMNYNIAATTLKVLNCTINQDRELTTTATNLVANGNVMTSSTKTKLASWNVGAK